MPTFTLRLPDDDREALDAIALLTGRPVAGVIREAVVRVLDEFVVSGDAERLLEEQNRATAAAVQLLRDWLAR